ncbi:hypothetical protein LTR62_006015 [Meristemomyces frigidus]|uniref:Uncharacterized protein n=1 Tax=Meristemomyces frigidus TaxID=1508187 RepID=A0AAN7YMV4_9PEZI|nr:hypothetical protein LTR62_006015 [Meristemomyces frigidus]
MKVDRAWAITQAQNNQWERRELFALRDVSKGTLVLMEQPLFTITKREGKTREERHLHIFGKVTKLSARDQDIYSGLHYELSGVDKPLCNARRHYLINKQYTAKNLAACVDHLKLIAIFKSDCTGDGKDA